MRYIFFSSCLFAIACYHWTQIIIKKRRFMGDGDTEAKKWHFRHASSFTHFKWNEKHSKIHKKRPEQHSVKMWELRWVTFNLPSGVSLFQCLVGKISLNHKHSQQNTTEYHLLQEKKKTSNPANSHSNEHSTQNVFNSRIYSFVAQWI